MKMSGNTILITGGLNLRNLFKLMSRVAPQFILNRFSKPVEAMVVDSTSP